MTREQFHHLVNHPASIGETAAEQLPELIRQFPYCQALRYLQLRYLSEKESIHYPLQLKITSAYSPDRGRLFRVIHPEPEIHLIPDEQDLTQQEAAKDVKQEAVHQQPVITPENIQVSKPQQPETPPAVAQKENEPLTQSLDHTLAQLEHWESSSLP
jgi:hypothetical protein